MNEFEKACSELEEDTTYESEFENAIEFVRDSDRATVTFCQGRFITKIEKLAEKYPDEVQIVHRNYNRGGKVSSIVAHIPVKAIHLNILKGRERTEEEIERAKEALAKYRESQREPLPFE